MSRPVPPPLADSVAEAIARRFRAGDSVPDLAVDYDRSPEEIEAAIRRFMLAIGKRGGR